MANSTQWITPDQYAVNTSASWFRGVKSASGLPMLEYKANLGADANVVITIPIPIQVNAAGVGQHIKTVELWHYLSATSAGVTPISAGGGTVNFRELLFADATLVIMGVAASAGKVSAGVFNTPNSLTGGGLPAALVSGTGWSPTTLSAAGTAIASLWTSASLEKFTNCVIPAEKSGQASPYIPRNAHAIVMAISASLGASALWEHYGCLVTYD